LRSCSLIHTGIARIPSTTHQFRLLELNWRAATSIVALRGQFAQTRRSPCRNFSVSAGDSAQPTQWLHEVGFNSSVPEVFATSSLSKHQVLPKPLAISVPINDEGNSRTEVRRIRDSRHNSHDQKCCWYWCVSKFADAVPSASTIARRGLDVTRRRVRRSRFQARVLFGRRS